jgi:hypothetical protein
MDSETKITFCQPLLNKRYQTLVNSDREWGRFKLILQLPGPVHVMEY